MNLTTIGTVATLCVASLLMSCAGGSTTLPPGGDGSASVSAPTATSPSSVVTPSVTPSPSAAPAYLPPEEDAKALLPAKGMPGARATDAWQKVYPTSSSRSGFVESWVTFVSGSAACRQLLDGHPMTAGSSAGQVLRSNNLTAEQMVSSMQTEADAKALMAQNVAQISKCRQFKGKFDGHVYTFHHEGKIAKQGIAGEQTVTHRLQATTSANREVVVWMLESRLGGEVLFLDLNPATEKGSDQVTLVAFVASSTFIDAVTAYRSTHPRAA